MLALGISAGVVGVLLVGQKVPARTAVVARVV